MSFMDLVVINIFVETQQINPAVKNLSNKQVLILNTIEINAVYILFKYLTEIAKICDCIILLMVNTILTVSVYIFYLQH